MTKLRIFFATDVHGSEKCFLKFVNAGKFYKADAVILGGDITGKPGTTLLVHRSSGPAKRILLVGLGTQDNVSNRSFTSAVQAVARVFASLGATDGMLALPLAVLKRRPGEAGAVTIDPEPPAWRDSLAALHVGQAHRIVLGFDARWWARAGEEGPSFVHGSTEPFPIQPRRSHVIFSPDQ
mgnify:CR=1 FL=1